MLVTFLVVYQKMKKSDLPSKNCKQCHRPFTWRKKWKRDWVNIFFCSDRCKRAYKLNFK